MATRRPYSPSWVNRVIDWIDQLPIPAWAFYALLYLASAVGLHLAGWLNGSPWGSISPAPLYNAIWLPLVFIVIHTTDHLADEAISRFAPAVPTRLAELEDLRYRITGMPAGVVLALSLIAAAFLLAAAIAEPALIFTGPPVKEIHPISWVLGIFVGITSYSMTPVMIYHAGRQLYLVTRAYSLVGKVNVFHQQPLYSFSGLTMRTAFFFLLMVYITYLGGFLYEVSASESAVNLVLSVVIVPLSIVIATVPLWGIHLRLARAKQVALEESGTKIERVQKRIYAIVEKGRYTQSRQLDAALSSLFKVHDRVKDIATWPWNPGTLRNFLSAVFLPLGLWAIQQVLVRLF